MWWSNIEMPELDPSKKSTDAATKVGDMIRSGRLQPEEEVISEIEVKRLSS